MANPMKGEATATLASGQTLTLAFDFGALIEAEDLIGEPMIDVLANIGQRTPRLKVIRGLLWGGLRRHHAELSPDDAAELMLTDSQAVTTALMKAIGSAFPKPEGKQGAHPPSPSRKARGTGTRS